LDLARRIAADPIAAEKHHGAGQESYFLGLQRAV
jgi:hypothetical protein